MTTTLADDYLPTYDVSDGVAVVAHADVSVAWDALMNVDLIEVGRRRPLVAALGALRMLPDLVSHLLHGERPTHPAHLRVRDLAGIPLGRGAGCCWSAASKTKLPWDSWASSGGRSSSSPRSPQPRNSAPSPPLGSPRPSTHSPYAPSVLTARYSRASCARRRPARTPSGGSVATGHSGWDSGAHLLVHGLLDVTREIAEQRNPRFPLEEAG